MRLQPVGHPGAHALADRPADHVPQRRVLAGEHRRRQPVPTGSGQASTTQSVPVPVAGAPDRRLGCRPSSTAAVRASTAMLSASSAASSDSGADTATQDVDGADRCQPAARAISSAQGIAQAHRRQRLGSNPSASAPARRYRPVARWSAGPRPPPARPPASATGTAPGVHLQRQLGVGHPHPGHRRHPPPPAVPDGPARHLHRRGKRTTSSRSGWRFDRPVDRARGLQGRWRQRSPPPFTIKFGTLKGSRPPRQTGSAGRRHSLPSPKRMPPWATSSTRSRSGPAVNSWQLPAGLSTTVPG